MSKYDAAQNQRSYQGSPVGQRKSPGTPNSRKSRVLRMSSSFHADSQNIGNNAGGYDVLNSSFRRRSSVLGSSRLDPFSTLALVGKDDDTGQETNKEIKSARLSGLASGSHQNCVRSNSSLASATKILRQIPAIALIGIFHLMVGIPFGVSYFPMYWSSHPGDDAATSITNTNDDDASFHEEGQFPIPGKEALGIRMFLFSTLVAQVVFAYFSGFKNPIGLQMVENIGFTKELAAVAISHQGYGVEALSTVMVMFGIASLLVGTVFFLLGKFQLGKIVYFFPRHVLVGLIGGIGILLCKTGLENTIAQTVGITSMIESWKLWIIVVALEVLLRILERATTDSRGTPRFALLSPIYFCMITPCFYLALWVFNISISESKNAGYFFPSLSNSGESDVSLNSNFGEPSPWDMWKVIDFSSVSWVAIWDSFPTMIALILFSLIHVPINIPAFALSTNTDANMNKELIAHGISNMLAGAGCGLQNYLAYTQSVLYDKSGGSGRVSGLAVATLTAILFFVGPTIASYIPRCMAGTLLLHVGIDLFLEGVWDSYGKFDLLEYTGIWLIVIVMSIYGMEAAMVAGGIAAVSTYAVQNVAYLSPIRGVMPATTLRSSDWNRNAASEAILVNSDTGRSRILVIQLQGHLFFGNTAFFTDQMHDLLSPSSKKKEDNETESNVSGEMKVPLVLIIDFGLVLGIDSSAAHAIVKLKDSILKENHINLCVFVTGSDEGFPTEFDLSDQLSADYNKHSKAFSPSDETSLLLGQNEDAESQENSQYVGSRVCNSLDIALMEAEDALIARQNPLLLENDILSERTLNVQSNRLSLQEERNEFVSKFKDLCADDISSDDANKIFASFEREVFQEGEIIWKQNDQSNSVKLLLLGRLIAELENEAGTTEIVPVGSMIGELGLVNGNPRMSTVRCLSKEAVLYSMSRTSFQELISKQPHLARYIDLICVKYLALRVQHVSNRIFETRCLPV